MPTFAELAGIEIEEVGRYGCPVCAKRFETLRDKRIHLKSEHPRIKKS
jgi:hypothetical protein